MPPSFVQVTTTLPLDRLRHELADAPPLPALSGAEYARTHAVYEAASDQRGLLREWLVREVPPLLAEHDPVRVVGVGVGEGALDVPLAAALARGGRAVRYTGVEPHPPAASAFLAGLAGLAAPSLVPAVVVGDFARHDPGHPAADAQGYVKRPNVDGLVEALDLKEAQRAYEANLNVIETARSMDQRTLELLKR